MTGRPRGRTLPFALGALVAGGVLVAASRLPLERWLLALVEWIRSAGALGMGAFALAYVLAAVLLLPGSLLTLGAGFAYGPLVGTLLVSPVSVAAATAAFLLGRTVARQAVARRVAGNPRFAAIDEAVGADGFRIVLLLRLSPVFPFNLLNYGLALTSVRLRDYVLASFLGMAPATFLYAYLGSLVTSAAELLDGRTPEAGPWGPALLVLGLLATLAVTIVITRAARRALLRLLPGERSEPAEQRPS